MKPEIERILRLITFPPDCEPLRVQREQIFLMSSQELLTFLLSLEDFLQQPSAELIHDCAYHYLLAGTIALEENKTRPALRWLAQAADSFRRQNDFYNEALACWLAGLACARDHQVAQAKRYYQQASDKINCWASLEDQMESNIYHQIRQGIESSLAATQQPQPAPAGAATAAGPATTLSFLSLRSFPHFGSVQAGPNGPVWAESEGTEITIAIDGFSIDTVTYRVFSVRQGDSRINLQRHQHYGWVTVHGDSMNAAKPVPLTDGDLALFYAADTAANNEIVIASHPDDSGSGYQYMIKRWRASQQAFVSESQKEYEPIPYDHHHRILGVVIAVAKRPSL